MRYDNRMGRNSCGFTLLEVLVALGIVAVLIGILVPVLLHDQSKARQTTCLSNEQSLVQGFQLYLTDYDGFFPPVYGGTVSFTPGSEFREPDKLWVSLIHNQIKARDALYCPERGSYDIQKSDNFILCGYCYNKNLGDLKVNHQDKITSLRTARDAQLTDTSRVVVLAEGRLGLLAAYGPDIDPGMMFAQETVTVLPMDELRQMQAGGLRHNHGANNDCSWQQYEESPKIGDSSSCIFRWSFETELFASGQEFGSGAVADDRSDSKNLASLLRKRAA